MCVDALNKLREKAKNDSCMEVSLKNLTSVNYLVLDGQQPVAIPVFTVTSSEYLLFRVSNMPKIEM
jgi:hypothetical protein